MCKFGKFQQTSFSPVATTAPAHVDSSAIHHAPENVRCHMCIHNTDIQLTLQIFVIIIVLIPNILLTVHSSETSSTDHV